MRRPRPRPRFAALSLAAPLLLGLLVVSLPTASRALAFTVEIEVDSVSNDLLATGLQPGDRIQASFAHGGCAASDTYCLDYYGVTETYGEYGDGLVLSLGVELPGHQLDADNLGSLLFSDSVEIRNGWVAVYDQYRFGMSTPAYGAVVTPAPTAIGGNEIDDIDYWYVSSTLVLRDDDGTVFDDALVPSSLPPLGEFEHRTFSLSLSLSYTDVDSTSHYENVLSFTGTVLPEPATGCLLGSGLLVLLASGSGGRARRR